MDTQTAQYPGARMGPKKKRLTRKLTFVLSERDCHAAIIKAESADESLSEYLRRLVKDDTAGVEVPDGASPPLIRSDRQSIQ